jgi:DNA-binding transcriptional regulator YiaG
MSEKVKEYVYTGLGFPITLEDVEVVSFKGIVLPIIDVKKVAALAINNLILQKSNFTGNQLNFIRTGFLLKGEDKLAALLKVPLTELKKWEDAGDKKVDMGTSTMNLLKQQMKDQHSMNNKLLSSLSQFSSAKKPPTPSADFSTPDPEKKKPPRKR